ncbi:2-phospho-D-glycerate hydro-lyase [Aphelenchoides besseyi]|nr:2-phospho-D-glycerate hydro-lyase [Aphelenchoides besseyi]
MPHPNKRLHLWTPNVASQEDMETATSLYNEQRFRTGANAGPSNVLQQTATIVEVLARHINDLCGKPTIVEVKLTTTGTGGVFRAAVYQGKGVLTAVSNIKKKIGPALVASGLQVTEQAAIDKLMIELDGTENKANLGANAILAVSMAVCKAGAKHSDIPLYRYIAQLAGTPKIVIPVPAFNVINGGSHAGNKLAVQEFMILPVGAKNFDKAMRMGSKIYDHLKVEIKRHHGLTAAVDDEKGFAPNIQNDKEALDLLKTFISKAGYFGKVKIGMDIGASEFYKDGKYDLDFKNEKSDPSKWIDGDQLEELYKSFIKDYPVVSIEDAFHQDDSDSWSKLLASTSIQLVGNDLTVTNPKRIRQAIEKKSGNCLLLKVNQIGTVTESIEAAKLARENGWGVMVSDRFGETDDTFIADFVVGLSTGQIKTGAPCRSEQLKKYDRICSIEKELKNKAVYAGEKFRNPLA